MAPEALGIPDRPVVLDYQTEFLHHGGESGERAPGSTSVGMSWTLFCAHSRSAFSWVVAGTRLTPSAALKIEWVPGGRACCTVAACYSGGRLILRVIPPLG